MAYEWLKYGMEKQVNALSNQALGVGWTSQYLYRDVTKPLESFPEGELFGGGAWIYRGEAVNSGPLLRLSTGSFNFTRILNESHLNAAGVPVGSAYRCEWRFKYEDSKFYFFSYLNGDLVRTAEYNISAPGGVLSLDPIWHREMYLCDDDPILGYWEFRTVPVTSLPGQPLSNAQMSGSWSADESFEQRAVLDTSAVPDGNTILGYIVEQQTYAKKTSPRLLTESSFQVELHNNESEVRNLQLLAANQNPNTTQFVQVLPVTFEHPVPAPQLNPELKLKYIHVPEE